MVDNVYKNHERTYARVNVRRRKRIVCRFPASRCMTETAEKQGRYSMENAVKEMRAGMDNEAEISLRESIFKTKRRFSLAKNPTPRAAENGASAKPRGANKKEKSFPERNKRLSFSFSVK